MVNGDPIRPSTVLYGHENEESLCLVEMYPECVIASWDALVFLLDAENIERRVQLNAEKKIECLCKLQTSGKIASHDMQICVTRNQFLSAD